jgi:hypothetical protein
MKSRWDLARSLCAQACIDMTCNNCRSSMLRTHGWVRFEKSFKRPVGRHGRIPYQER